MRNLVRLARAALVEWGFERPRLTPLRNVYNTTFRVGRGHVLRMQFPGLHEAATVRSEMLWLAALARDTDLAVPEPVATPNGDLVVLASAEGVPESRVCSLFTWVDGDFLDGEELTPSHLEG